MPHQHQCQIWITCISHLNNCNIIVSSSQKTILAIPERTTVREPVYKHAGASPPMPVLDVIKLSDRHFRELLQNLTNAVGISVGTTACLQEA